MTTYVLKEETGLSVRGGPVTIHFDRVPQDARIVASNDSGEPTELVKRLGAGVAILPNVDQTLTVGIESGMTSFDRGTSVSVRLQIDSGFGREADEIHFQSPMDVSGDFHHSLFSISPDAEMLRVSLVQDARRPSAALTDLAEASRVAAVRLVNASRRIPDIENLHIVIDGSASFKQAAAAGLHEVLEILTGVTEALVGIDSLNVSIADRELTPIRATSSETLVDQTMRAFEAHPLRSTFMPQIALARQPSKTLTFVVTDAYDPTLSDPDGNGIGPSPVHQVVLVPTAPGARTADNSTVIIGASLTGPIPLDDRSRSTELDAFVQSLLAAAAEPLVTEERPR